MLTLQEHSCPWRAATLATNVRRVDGNAQLAAEIRAWMNRVMAEKDLTVTSWAEKARVARTTIARPIKDGYEFVTSSRTLAKLAAAAGVEPPSFQPAAKDVRIVPAFLPIRYRVQAGHWFEVEFEEPPSLSSYAVSPDPRYSNWPQWLEEVRGDSVDKKIRPGMLAHVVDAIEMGYGARDGDWVVVERRRDQGATHERSIKQIHIRPDGGVELWPRSTNPKWSKPLRLNSKGPRIVAVGGVTPEDGDDVEVEIVGLVIGSYDPDF